MLLRWSGGTGSTPPALRVCVFVLALVLTLRPVTCAAANLTTWGYQDTFRDPHNGGFGGESNLFLSSMWHTISNLSIMQCQSYLCVIFLGTIPSYVLTLSPKTIDAHVVRMKRTLSMDASHSSPHRKCRIV